LGGTQATTSAQASRSRRVANSDLVREHFALFNGGISGHIIDDKSRPFLRTRCAGKPKQNTPRQIAPASQRKACVAVQSAAPVVLYRDKGQSQISG